MNKEEKLVKTLTDIYDIEEMSEILEELELDILLQAILHNMITVRKYTVESDIEHIFEYRGDNLFSKKACLLSTINNSMYSGELFESHNTELWITEDLELKIVNSFSVNISFSHTSFATEYRLVYQETVNYVDMPLSLDDLIDDLKKLSITAYEIPIYEI